MAEKNIKFIDRDRNAIAGAEYTIYQGGKLLAIGETDSSGNIKPILEPISSKKKFEVYVKLKEQKQSNFIGEFLWINSWPLSIRLMLPGRYLLTVEKHEGENGIAKQNFYIVMKGDILSSIAQKHNTTLEELLLINSNLNNSNEIFVGQKIYLPINNRKYNGAQRSSSSTHPVTITSSNERHYTIVINGVMENKLLGSGMLHIRQGSKTISSIKITAGGFGSGAPQNGKYTVNHYRNRRKGSDYNKGMNLHQVGFSFDLNPLFQTKRSLLRIHPDGNNRGTLGCIGVVGNEKELLDFEKKIKDILKTQKNIPTIIDISGNPNNSTPPKKITVRE